MDLRTTTGRRGRTASARRRPPSTVRRSGILLGVAAAGALVFDVLVGAHPATEVEAGTTEPMSVAEQLGMTARSIPADGTPDLQPLEELAASRSSREAAQTAAAQAQAAADQAVVDRQQAEAAAAAAAAEAAAQAAAQAAAEAAAAEQAAAARAAAQSAASAPSASARGTDAAPGATAVARAGAVARISNSSGSVKPQVQAAANAVVSGVPGAGGITLGGTRPSATDPNGHPSGLALDYMVMSDEALGDAIAQYHIDHWAELGVQYVIWQQRMLSSPGGTWKPMADRGSVTENHYDHVHVNYVG